MRSTPRTAGGRRRIGAAPGLGSLLVLLGAALLGAAAPVHAFRGGELSAADRQLLDRNFKIILQKKKGPFSPNYCVCDDGSKRPVMDIEQGHHVTAVAHLGNLALRTGRSIEYDADNMRVIGNDQADKMITNPYRAPWKLPKV